VAHQLFHYYAQLTGQAVPATLAYDYVNVARADHSWRLRRLLRDRDRLVFCLNDAPEDGVEPMHSDTVTRFLQAFFPLPSEFECGSPGPSRPAEGRRPSGGASR